MQHREPCSAKLTILLLRMLQDNERHLVVDPRDTLAHAQRLRLAALSTFAVCVGQGRLRRPGGALFGHRCRYTPRALAKAAELGYTFYTHPEIEFFVLQQGFEPGKPPVPVDQAGYFDHVPHGTTHDFRRAAITMLESMGISVEFSHHEGAPGQNEIDLRYADALTTADNIMTFRTVIKEVALEQGVYATFMPKPFVQHPGSGMHTHMSLFEGDRNVFHENGAELPAEQDWTALHRGPAAARGGVHRDHQPMGELLHAALGRRRGAGVRLLGS